MILRNVVKSCSTQAIIKNMDLSQIFEQTKVNKAFKTRKQAI